MLLLVCFINNLLVLACELRPLRLIKVKPLRYLFNVDFVSFFCSELKRRMKAQKKAEEKEAKNAQQKDEPKNNSTPKVKPIDESQIDPNVINYLFIENI